MRTWLYYRLSRDEDDEMNSLQNQRQILIDYAEQNCYEVVGESFDDNVSGMTFNRKGLSEMEQAVSESLIDAVLVKDLSRLGRHRTQTALFIDHLRENNVKVISVTEGIDTANENDDLLIGFKQIFNDFYAKDISRKVKAGIRQKQKSSGLILSLPLGFYHDKNTNTIEIDNETAEHVREVFRLYVEGYGLTTIARLMNERGVRSPEYYQNRRLADWKPQISKKYLWVQTAVKRILTNELYIGTLVNHKTVTSKIYKTKTAIPVEEQYRHENFCPPIIDETTWKQAQFLLKQRAEIKPRSSGGRKLHRYAGLIKCAECGSHLIAKTRKWNGRKYVEYTCNSNHRYGKAYCTPHRIRESQLDELIHQEFDLLREQVYVNSEKYADILKSWLKKKPAYDLQIKHHNEKILALRQQIEDLIMERISDKSRSDIYNSMIEKREREIEELQKRISDCRNYDQVCRQKQEELRETSVLLDEILTQGEISDANLRMLVQEVVIHQNEDKSIDVHFTLNGNFKNSSMLIIEQNLDIDI